MARDSMPRVVSSTDATLAAIVSPVVTAPIVTTITTIEPVKTTTLTGTTSTGGTLKANNLTPVEHILDISSQLIVNQAALKLKHAAIRPVIDAFAATVKR